MTTIQRRIANPPVHPISALALVIADWSATGLNILTVMDAYWPVTLGVALAAALAVFLVERSLAQASERGAALRAACAVPLIVLPLPLLGTAVGLALLAWALVSWLSQRGART